MNRADPIPAVREDEATGETAAVFADLRATLGVSFVNLIWRHLATMPQMLEWTWALVKPLHASNALLEAGETLRAGVAVPDGIKQPACVFDAVGVTAADRVVIGQMLGDYNAANASNLLCLLVAQSVLAGELPGQFRTARSTSLVPRTADQALPRLPGLHELSPAVRTLVVELDGFGRFAPTEAIASLYRHLAHWPGFLAVAHATLSVPHHDGRLLAEHGKTRDRAQKLASERVLPLASASRLPVCAEVDAAQASLQMFTEHMIARMVTMGETMRALLPA
jgi:hypothetical protein